MSSVSYLVVQITPSSPVDSGTFGEYLDGLQIVVYPADADQSTTAPLGQIPPAGGLAYVSVVLIEIPWTAGVYVTAVSKEVAASTPPQASNNFGTQLTMESVDGIAYGATVVCPANTNLFQGGSNVTNTLAQPTVDLSQTIQNFVAAGTVVTFFYQYGAGDITLGANNESFSLQQKASAATSNTTLKLTSTNGIAVGMSVSGGGVTGTVQVVSVNSTSVTLSTAVNVAKNAAVTFSFNLNSGIVQWVEQQPFNTIFGTAFIPIPQSVATAVIPLNTPPPANSYLDISLAVTRNGIPIPVDTDYYNVIVSSSAALPTPDAYQAIDLKATSFYLSLPAPPLTKAIGLVIPSDGSAPMFDKLLPAMQQAAANDPYFPAALDLTQLSVDECTRMAYDIVWSQQNVLPLPPDPLEQLYTDPPNDGAASNGNNGTNGDEQDRQKFEGTLNSFYSTRNSIAVRLTKFVAAASGALYCEQKSVQALQAVLEFIVEPSDFATPSPVESEVLLTGLSPTGVNFGIPAGFFYALTTNMDKTATGPVRYQMATGDTAERALQAFGQSINTGAIEDSEPFSSLVPPQPIGALNSAQAARRLQALAVTSASTTPVVALPSAGPLVNLVNAWLGATTSSVPTYQSYQPSDPDEDAIIWALMLLNPVPTLPVPLTPADFTVTAQPNQAGFLQLVLGALTQGFLIPNSGPPLVPLATKIAAFLPSTTNPPTANPTVETLKGVTAAQWTTFFTSNPTWLPTFVQPVTPVQAGYITACIKTWVRAVQTFFTVSSLPNQVPALTPGAPQTLDFPSFDAISQAVAGLPAFGSMTAAQIATAVQGIFTPGTNAEAQAWLQQALTTINELYQIASVVPEITPNETPVKASLAFSVMEALYARGFRSAKEITAIPPANFQQALTGTVAYAYAGSATSGLYQAASNIAAPSWSSPPAGGSFEPINSDGSLTDCIPPPCLSPLGPVAYLQELLQLHEDASCETWASAQPNSQAPVLGSAIATRRGPLTSLLASPANLDVPLPAIDMVNECLENVAAGAPGVVVGAVYNTTLTETSLSAAPQWSSPATPVQQPAAYTNLAGDFSACRLPYAQSLDISRSYQRLLCACRWETMRTFRKEITEFVLAPAAPPADFQDYLWRYPVRIEIAAEYLGLSPQEFNTLFASNGTLPQGLQPWQLYGFASELVGRIPWTTVITEVPQFLSSTCLSYCEFLELQQSGLVAFSNADPAATDGKFPDCEPCCLDQLTISFGAPAPTPSLVQLAILIRLWRAIRQACGGGFSFSQLADICAVLGPLTGGPLSADFIRQLAALEMLRDHFGLPLSDGEKASGTGADRTPLLALWVGPTASKWNWAVEQLVERVQHFAHARHKCARREPEFIKLLAANLDPLSKLAGFDPQVATDTWHSRPACTLRFAEILAKICASDFSIGDLLFLVTAEGHLDGEDVFPLQEPNDALDAPLGLPEDEHPESLHALRRKLLSVQVSEEECGRWSWNRINTVLRHEFGYAANPDVLLSVGKHFFPNILASEGVSVDIGARRYVYANPVATPLPMWNVAPDGPFQCDPTSNPAEATMWTQVPLRDEAVIAKLAHVRTLSAAEQTAVQDLYFQPRLDLAPFAFLFPDFASADRHLIQEPDEKKRWEYFTRHFALTYARSKAIAEHLAHHVRAATGGRDREDRPDAAWLVLRNLFADENSAVAPGTLVDPSGNPPAVTWNPLPNGGAFAALLGLTGTGLLGEVSSDAGQILWREIRGPLDPFGEVRNRFNAPAPCVVPAMNYSAPEGDLGFASLHNGFVVSDRGGEELGGAQGYAARWSGVLLIDGDGRYEFHGPELRHLECGCEDRRSWRVVLKRGQRTWLLLSQRWPEEHREAMAALPLKRGAYELVIEYRQPAEDLSISDHIHRQHAGFELKYRGPDSHDHAEAIPLDRLFIEKKDGTLGNGIAAGDGTAPAYQAFLNTLYTSSLRDIRRTYQRAFKALLLADRFCLSARSGSDDGCSELGYMLQQKALFAGAGFARSGAAFTSNPVDFDFNFLPVKDDYLSPTAAQDPRADPTPDRVTAFFDSWERMFDYTQMRREARPERERSVWQLFDEAASKQPAHVGFLLRHLGIDSRHFDLLLSYYDGPAPGSLYSLSAPDLEDDRWVVRIWHGEEWIRRVERCCCPPDVSAAKPALWAADDPGAVVAPATVSGNQNLTAFVGQGMMARGESDGSGEIQRVNDGLRERARDALIAYLCRMNRVALADGSGGFAEAPRDLSQYLLLDVESGLREKASRIEEAITAVQTFVRQARLGLEPTWTVSRAFAMLWDRRFANFRTWQACKRRELYKETWIEWDEIERARRIEAFRFLESELQSATLSVAEPGGGEWWPDQRPPAYNGLGLLQSVVPSTLEQLPSTPPTQEGFTVLGTPENDGRNSWLAATSAASSGNSYSGGSTTTTSTVGARAKSVGPAALALNAAQDALPANLPFWIEAAIRLGTQFIRVAAAGEPAGSARFTPEHDGHQGCCVECGRVHPPMVDEYYFWLINAQQFVRPDQAFGVTLAAGTIPGTYQLGIQDSFYDQSQQQSVAWNDPDQLPALMNWPANPAVRLAWCRVHNGEFQQPRRSAECVQIKTSAGLQFLGRARDSLYFEVTGAATPPAGYTDLSQPGFRYDLACDQAVALPLPVAAAAVTLPGLPGGLPAYPFFAFNTPGASLFPASLFAPALAVATALRTRCRFDLALKWYELTFAPLANDCTWIDCAATTTTGGDTTGTTGGSSTVTGTVVEVQGSAPAAPSATAAKERSVLNPNPPTSPGACCDSTAVGIGQVRNRAVTLKFCQTLLEWGDHVMRHRPSPEAFQQARLLFDTASKIMGRRPRAVLLPDPATPQPLSSFTPATPPLSPWLMELYDHTADRLNLIRASVDARRLRNGAPNRDMPYFGDNPVREGWRTTHETCPTETEWCLPHSPYRFTFLIQKAVEIAGSLREFGSAFQTACEKGDAEYLASMHAEYEHELFELGLAARQEQWRDADWQIQALQQTKDLNQAELTYYNNLYQNGLINDEIQHQVLATTAMQTHTGASAVEAEGEAMKVIPDLFLGFPCTDSQIPIGTKLAGIFETIGKVMSIFADIQSATSNLDLTLAGWDRRSVEWLQRTQTIPIQIENIELSILGAQRRRGQALIELNNLQRQIEQSAETLNFLRDKFTTDRLYLWLQKETAGLYRKMYELALNAARQAEHAFNFERGHTTRRFVPNCVWNNPHEGLLAGERLLFALRHMEKSYFDENIREHELTKHFSLRQQFPAAYLRLRSTGYCEIDIPEWMFDLDYPGHYMRRIRNVSLTLPCVTGPYTGVHCRLTLLSSMTRIDPAVRPPAQHCCRDRHDRNGYEACPDDPRIVRQYAARESIATSSGQNDSGLFELNFRDDRYLPYEFLGAVCRVRIELPKENNYFDLETLSDLVLLMNYTSREGGPALREAAKEAAQGRLPGDGWCLLEARSDFPDAWQLFRDSHRRLELRFRRNLFPYIPGKPELFVSEFVLVFETDDDRGNGCVHVEFQVHDTCHQIRCVPAAKWPGMYHGSVSARLGPLEGRVDWNRVTVRFPEDCGAIRRVFLVCKYEAACMEEAVACCGARVF